MCPLSSLATYRRGVFHAIPLGGCCAVVRGLSPDDAGVGVTTDRKLPLQSGMHSREQLRRSRGKPGLGGQHPSSDVAVSCRPAPHGNEGVPGVLVILDVVHEH